MKIIKQSHEILGNINGPEILKSIELAGRTCYRTEGNITNESAPKFVKMLIDRGHEAMIEHVSLSVRFITARSVTHELVRHRLCSFAQESQRYCAYNKDKFGGEISVILPVWFYEVHEWVETHNKIAGEDQPKNFTRYLKWKRSCELTEEDYLEQLDLGAKPEEARDVLNNSCRTEIVVTANLREWRSSILKLRTSPAAHPQIRALMMPLLAEFKEKIPVVFDDIGVGVMNAG